MSNPIDFSKVFHWGYVVEDMDEALKHWKSIGAKVIVPPGAPEDLGVICCFILYENSVPIELIASVNDETEDTNESSKSGGLDHVCFFTDDMNEDIQKAEKAGGKLTIPPTYNSHFDRKLTFLSMPGGLMVEFMDRRAKGSLNKDPLADYLTLMERSTGD